jgi:hypothetical protein
MIAITSLTVAAPAAPRQARVALRIVDTSPLTVRGTGWHARERVRVKVAAEATTTRTVQTTLAGAFTTAFPTVTVQRCGDPVWITAIGASGARATVKLPVPECPPPLGNG